MPHKGATGKGQKTVTHVHLNWLHKRANIEAEPQGSPGRKEHPGQEWRTEAEGQSKWKCLEGKLEPGW